MPSNRMVLGTNWLGTDAGSPTTVGGLAGESPRTLLHRMRRALSVGEPGRPLALALLTFGATWVAVVIIAVTARGRTTPDLTDLTNLVTGLDVA